MRPEQTVAPMRRRRFLRRPEDVAAARRFVAGALTRGSEPRETARLLVSETVTSVLGRTATLQGDGMFEVGYVLGEDLLRVEVSDDGGPARLRRRLQAMETASGRGLQLVQAMARRWGVREGPAGRTIWFELDLPATG
jgi:serine/threonine-protein kinase RsbW